MRTSMLAPLSTCRLAAMATVSLLLTGGCAGTPAAAPVALFNGADLVGWDFFLVDPDAEMADVWHVEDGVLVCAGAPGGYLCTARDYQNFHLVVEWRWPGEPGNSGVLLRIAGVPQMLPSCAEAQLKSGSAGDMYGFHDYRIGGDPERLSEIGVPGWRLARLKDAENPPGQWNRYEITVEGDRIEVVLNGEVVNRAFGCDVRPGRIGLQSEGGEVHFRTVELTGR